MESSFFCKCFILRGKLGIGLFQKTATKCTFQCFSHSAVEKPKKRSHNWRDKGYHIQHLYYHLLGYDFGMAIRKTLWWTKIQYTVWYSTNDRHGCHNNYGYARWRHIWIILIWIVTNVILVTYAVFCFVFYAVVVYFRLFSFVKANNNCKENKNCW